MIKVETDSGIAVIQMEHGKVNAMDLEFCQRLTAELQQIESSQTRAAVLIGNDRVFSAGVDLVRILEAGQSYREQFLPALVACFKTIFRFSKPLVAAINGHALAGGCILATACDRRVAHAKARIGIPELRVGVPLPAIAIEIMRFAVATEALQSMVNVGQTFRGAEAIRVGLADLIVPQERLVELAIAEASTLLMIPDSVFSITKRQLRAPAERIVEQNELDFEQDVFELWGSVEIQNVIREYVRKRL
jgi:enoyl-CoA hydratase